MLDQAKVGGAEACPEPVEGKTFMVLILGGWCLLQNKAASNLTRLFNLVVISRMQIKIEQHAYVPFALC